MNRSTKPSTTPPTTTGGDSSNCGAFGNGAFGKRSIGGTSLDVSASLDLSASFGQKVGVGVGVVGEGSIATAAASLKHCQYNEGRNCMDREKTR